MNGHHSIVELGRGIGRGMLVEFGKWMLLGFGIVFVLGWAVQQLGYGWDSTDNRGAGLHSNMRLRTDYGTGCQYLESRDGALTPRLNRAGRQVCR